MNTADAIKKWNPLVEDLEPSLKAMAALVMEAEASYLRNLSEELRPKVIGPYLKYIFPILRRAVSRVTVLDMLSYVNRCEGFESFIHEVILDETTAIFEDEAHHRASCDMPIEELRENIDLRQLAERTAKTILSLPAEEIPAI